MAILFAMDYKQILCANIALRRRQLGMTQATLAERLHLSQDAISLIEKGTIAPKLSRLDNFARHLKCTVPELFRPYNEGKSTRIEMIQDALIGLPEDAQDAIVNLVIEASRVLNGRLDKG